MAVRHGYGKVAGTDALVFAYDTGDARNSYKGEPTTNYWDGVQYSIYNDNATNYRDQTFPLPPSPGYEVAKVVSNTLGTYSHSILWKAPYPNNDVATITNSIYAYLVEGSYVQVGQHWYPWYYGTQKAIPKNQWVKISETYSINEGNSYGVAALTYSTDGTAYFSMPQYEYKTHVTPFVNGIRSSTQGLIDLRGNSTIDLANVSFDANAQMTFDGTDDIIQISAASWNILQTFTLEAVFKPTGTAGSGYHVMFQKEGGFSGGAVYGLRAENQGNGNILAMICYDNQSANQNFLQSTTPTINGQTYHVVSTFDSSYNWKIYVNGVLQNSTTLTNLPFQNSSAIFIGRGDSRTMNGYLPISKIYNRALTADEVRNNYRHYKTRFDI